MAGSRQTTSRRVSGACHRHRCAAVAFEPLAGTREAEVPRAGEDTSAGRLAPIEVDLPPKLWSHPTLWSYLAAGLDAAHGGAGGRGKIGKKLRVSPLTMEESACYNASTFAAGGSPSSGCLRARVRRCRTNRDHIGVTILGVLASKVLCADWPKVKGFCPRASALKLHGLLPTLGMVRAHARKDDRTKAYRCRRYNS